MRGRRAGAPPVQVVPARPPAAAVELADRRDEHRVPSGRSTCSCSRRTGSCQQTSGLVVSGCTPVRSAMRCSAQPLPPAKPGRLRKTQAPSTTRVRSEPSPLSSAAESSSVQSPRPTGGELPVLVGEGGDRGGDPRQVVVVGEEGAVAAAAVVRPSLDDAGAAAAEDAGPGRGQPGQVGADDVLRVGRVGELDPLAGEVERDLLVRVVRHGPSVGRGNLPPWPLRTLSSTATSIRSPAPAATSRSDCASSASAPGRLRGGDEVPHARYWRGPVAEGEGEIGFAAQKQYLSFYVVRTDVMGAHRSAWPGWTSERGRCAIAVPSFDEAVVRSILEMTAATSGRALAMQTGFMRLGVLDVGSNTVHLLVVDAHRGAHPTPMHDDRSVLRLAEHIGADDVLSKAGEKALLKAVQDACDRARRRARRAAGPGDVGHPRGVERPGGAGPDPRAHRRRPAGAHRGGGGPPDVPRRPPVVRLERRASCWSSTSAVARSSWRAAWTRTPTSRSRCRWAPGA